MIHLHKKRYEYFEEVNEGVLRNIPRSAASANAMVLDGGCGRGALSAAIQDKGYAVWGIERNEEAARVAQQRIEKVIHASLTHTGDVIREIGDRQFDYIILSDVLEHLYDPFMVLKEYLSLLKEDGTLIISVPNLVAWDNRFRILFGTFDYTDIGIMDRTHIRHFTFKTTRQLAEAAGCRVIKVDFTPYFTRALLPLIRRLFLKGQDVTVVDRGKIMGSPLYKFYLRYVYPVEHAAGRVCKGLFAFRIIMVCKKQYACPHS